MGKLGKLNCEDGTTTDLDLKYKQLISNINKQTKDEDENQSGSDKEDDKEGEEEGDKSND